MNFTKNIQTVSDLGATQLVTMFDLLPGILFWIKDNQHRFVHVNQAFVEHSIFSDRKEIISKTDYDLFPVHLAKQFHKDDEKILSGEEITERLEINMASDGDSAWYTTTKRPIYNNEGNIVGSYGITHHLDKQALVLASVEALKVPVDYVRENFADNLTIESLAEASFLSVSALERRFKKYLKKTPKQFINEVRLEHAQRLLVETNKPISQVGDECGFPNPSYFTQQFRAFFEELPSEFRKNYRGK